LDQRQSKASAAADSRISTVEDSFVFHISSITASQMTKPPQEKPNSATPSVAD